MWLGLGLITALAAALRVFRLDAGGLWYDELIMARLTAGSLADVWHQITIGRPPLYPLIAWAWECVLGSSDAAIRSLSAVCGVATVPAIFFAGRRLFNARVGLVAALLLAVSPFQVYYSQEHRYYALLLLLGTVSVWLLLRAIGIYGRCREPSGPAGRATWCGYVAASVLMFYTHPISAFLLLSMGIAVLAIGLCGGLAPGRLKRFLVAQVIILLSILPWVVVPMMLAAQHVEATENGQAVDGFMPWIAPTPWWTPVRTAANFLLLGKKFVRPEWAAAGLGLAFAGLAWRWWRGRAEAAGTRVRGGLGGSWWIAACWAGGAVAVMAVISCLVKPIYVDRYVIVAAAGLYVLVAAVLVAAARWLPLWAGAGAWVLAMAGALVSYYDDPQKGAWPAAAAWLDEHLEPGDALAFASERGSASETQHVRDNWFWYAKQHGAGEPAAVFVRAEPAAVAEQLLDANGPGGSVWLVMWRDPDRPVGLAEAFADGPIHGLALDRAELFFDLTLLRFVAEGPESPLADPMGEAP